MPLHNKAIQTSNLWGKEQSEKARKSYIQPYMHYYENRYLQIDASVQSCKTFILF